MTWSSSWRPANSYVVSPSNGNTSLSVTLGGNPVGSVPGGDTLEFVGSAGTVTIDGESGTGTNDVFTILNGSVQFGGDDDLDGSTITFHSSLITRDVIAQGATNLFNIQGTIGPGPSGSLVGDSGTNEFVFGATGQFRGDIQGEGSSTLSYGAYSKGVSVNLGNGTDGTATGVIGPVTGITAIIGSNYNDTLNAGTVPDVVLTGGLGTNTLTGKPNSVSVVESLSSSYTLTSARQGGIQSTGKLTGTSPSFIDNLHGITVAVLTGSSGTSDSFNVSGWTGTGSLIAPSGTGTVTDVGAGAISLTNAQLTAPNMTLSLSGIITANLTDDDSGSSFTVTGWTGGGKLVGTSEMLVNSVTSSVTLANTSLMVTGLPNLTLKGITVANLTDTAGGNTFTVSGWTGTGSLTDTGSIADTVAASLSANFGLSDTSLAFSNGMSLNLSGFGTANLTATSAGKSFTVNGWTGNGSLTDTSGKLNATEYGGFTLTDSKLSSTAGVSLDLNGITSATVTDSSPGGQTFNITGWTGRGAFRGQFETLIDSVSSSTTLTTDSLAVTGQPIQRLSGFVTANLTDMAGGNTFDLSGWTAIGSLTNSGATGDTVTVTQSTDSP